MPPPLPPRNPPAAPSVSHTCSPQNPAAKFRGRLRPAPFPSRGHGAAAEPRTFSLPHGRNPRPSRSRRRRPDPAGKGRQVHRREPVETRGHGRPSRHLQGYPRSSPAGTAGPAQGGPVQRRCPTMSSDVNSRRFPANPNGPHGLQRFGPPRRPSLSSSTSSLCSFTRFHRRPTAANGLRQFGPRRPARDILRDILLLVRFSHLPTPPPLHRENGRHRRPTASP